MQVVDASVLADALLDDGSVGERARAALERDDHWAAPHHVHVEVLSVVRGRMLGQKISFERADDAVLALDSLRIEHVAPDQLTPRIWELRGNITPYDAAYVATAELLDCPLLTADRRLAKARGIRCELQLLQDL